MITPKNHKKYNDLPSTTGETIMQLWKVNVTVTDWFDDMENGEASKCKSRLFTKEGLALEYANNVTQYYMKPEMYNKYKNNPPLIHIGETRVVMLINDNDTKMSQLAERISNNPKYINRYSKEDIEQALLSEGPYSKNERLKQLYEIIENDDDYHDIIVASEIHSHEITISVSTIDVDLPTDQLSLP